MKRSAVVFDLSIVYFLLFVCHLRLFFQFDVQGLCIKCAHNRAVIGGLTGFNDRVLKRMERLVSIVQASCKMVIIIIIIMETFYPLQTLLYMMTPIILN